MTIEQIDELIKDLEDNCEWAERSIWEVPIDLPDNLALAIDGLKELKQWHKLLSVEEGYPVTAEELEEAKEIKRKQERKVNMLKRLLEG